MQQPFTLILLIVVIVAVVKILDSYFRQRSQAQDNMSDREAEEINAKIEELEERVRVLEQIVTDPREALSRQISNLE